MKVMLGVMLAVLVALQYRLWFGDGSLQEFWRLHEIAEEKHAEVARVQNRNQALAAEVADLKDGFDALEERARTELGMISSDETFYQFVRDSRQSSMTQKPMIQGSMIQGSATQRPANQSLLNQ